MLPYEVNTRGEGIAAAAGAVWVPPAPSDGGFYDVRGPHATRVGKESARTDVFIDLQKAYDSVNRTLLCLAGARSLRSIATDD